ncbi:MAG: glycosyltransferase family 1 protein [Thermoleophilia bacterium]
MRIAIDVSPLSHPRTGIGNYLRGMLAGLALAAGGRHELVAFAPATPRGAAAIRSALDGIPVELALRELPVAHPVRTAWSRLGRPAVERFLGPIDVLHFSDWMYPPQRHGVRATTVYDLVPSLFPEWTTARTREMHVRKLEHAVRTCTLLVAISEHTRGDLVERAGARVEATAVAYPGIDPRFTPDGPAAGGAPYVLAVSTLEPRKGLDDLVRAFARLRSRRPELTLAIAGAEGWGDRPPLEGEGVRLLGFVDDDELARLYRGAAALAYPSRFEGFGMPIVEALACGAPVVANASPSLDEAAGEAAWRADAADPEAFGAAIEAAIDGGDARRQAGLAHAARFTWRACGEALLAAYAAAGRL